MKLELISEMNHQTKQSRIKVLDAVADDYIMHTGWMSVDMVEDLEHSISSIVFAIRDFRMKNFPESESIDD